MAKEIDNSFRFNNECQDLDDSIENELSFEIIRGQELQFFRDIICEAFIGDRENFQIKY